MRLINSGLLILSLFGIFSISIPHAKCDDLYANDYFDEDDFEDDEDIDEDDISDDVEVRQLFGKKQRLFNVPLELVPLQQPTAPVVAQQLDVQEVKRLMSCPPEFDLVGTECVTNEVVRGNQICPPGHKLIDSQCLLFARPRRDCPDSFQLTLDRCSAVDVVPVQYTCPDGSIDSTGRGCRIVTAQGPQCPAGYRFEGDACVQRFPPSVSCPPGYTSGHKGCIKIHAFDASPMCPVGSELDVHFGKKCVTLKNRAPKCPKGFKMDKETAKCIRKVKKLLAPCPPGFVPEMHNHICEKRVQIPPQLSCPVDSVLDSRTGLCLSAYPEIITCPDGLQRSRSDPGMCDQIVPEIATCPSGTRSIGHGPELRCQSVIEHDMIECCQTGFEPTQDGKCQRIEQFKAVPSCVDCVVVRKAPAIFKCPAQFVSRGSVCVMTHTEACQPATDCSFYSRMLDATTSSSLRALQPIDPTAIIPVECRGQLPPKMCKRDEVIPAEVKCHEESVFDGESCVERTELVAEPRCNVGVLKPETGLCVKITTLPLKTECAPGSTRIGQRCVSYEEHVPEFSCPDRSIVDRATGSCVVRSPVIREVPEPVRNAPVPLCPIGTMQGNMCWDVERIPRPRMCPEHSIPSESRGIMKKLDIHREKYCLLFSEMIVPAPLKKFVKPVFFCADGSQSKHMKCHSQDRAVPIPECPLGSLMVENLCVRKMIPIHAHPRVTSAVAIPVCPVNTVVQGTKCVSTRQIEAHVICPPGFHPVPVEHGAPGCAKTAGFIHVCPVGTTETADGCLRRVSRPPTYTMVPVSCNEPECY